MGFCIYYTESVKRDYKSVRKEREPNRRRTTWSNLLDVPARTTTENFQLAINSFSFSTVFVFPV